MFSDVPEIKCLRCGKCCGLILCTEKEYEEILKFTVENNVVPNKLNLDCPFMFKKDGLFSCLIYPVRPFICRLFGHSPRLQCANGNNKNIDCKLEYKITSKYCKKLGSPVILLNNIFNDLTSRGNVKT